MHRPFEAFRRGRTNRPASIHYARPTSGLSANRLLYRRPLRLEYLEDRSLLSLAPTGVDLLPGSDSGIFDDDNLTNRDNSAAETALDFAVSGTVAGATVTLYADGTAIGTAVATDTVTTITTNGAHDLADGPHSIIARQTEPGDSESDDSPALGVTVDTVGPARSRADGQAAGRRRRGGRPLRLQRLDQRHHGHCRRVQDDDHGSDSGSAYVFEDTGSGWIQVAKLTAVDGAAGDYFGFSVVDQRQRRRSSGRTATTTSAPTPARPTSSRTRARAGSRSPSSPPPTATRRRFLRLQRLDQRHHGHCRGVLRRRTAATRPARPTFSRTRVRAGRRSPSSPPATARRATSSAVSVSISGTTAIVGAYRDDDRGSDSGSAYVFEDTGSGWTQVAKLTASDGAADDQFRLSRLDQRHHGDRRGVTATTTAATSPARPTSSRTPARAGPRSPSSPPPTARRATASATASRSAAARRSSAAYGDDDRGQRFRFGLRLRDTGSGWTQVAKLTAGDGAAGDDFGNSVSISGDTTLVGAHGDDDLGSEFRLGLRLRRRRAAGGRHGRQSPRPDHQRHDARAERSSSPSRSTAATATSPRSIRTAIPSRPTPSPAGEATFSRSRSRRPLTVDGEYTVTLHGTARSRTRRATPCSVPSRP